MKCLHMYSKYHEGNDTDNKKAIRLFIIKMRII